MMIYSWLGEALNQEVGAQTALAMVKDLASELERLWETKASPRGRPHDLLPPVREGPAKNHRLNIQFFDCTASSSAE